MGCATSNKTEVVLPAKRRQVRTIKELSITPNDLVQERFGKITRDYVILNPPIGKGSYGEVRRAIHRITNTMRAIKVIEKQQTSTEEQEKLRREVEILRQLDHPNIIRIYEFYQDLKFFYIVTELCTGGELFEQITYHKYFSESKAAEIMQQILRAVYYCHRVGIVHRFEFFFFFVRDLKPENIIFESKNPGAPLKIVDFGTSRVFGNKKMNQKLGTPYYIAPEVIDRNYNEKCDIWSCGVIMYILLCGYPPFYGQCEKQIMEKVKIGKYSFDGDEWFVVSQEAKTFIGKMLEKDVSKRYTAEQAIQDLWLNRAQQQPAELPQLTEALNNMKSFRADKKLQEAAWIFIVNSMATREEKTQLLKVFESLDLNHDGMLSREELIIGYSKIMPNDEAQEEVDRIMQNVDKNNSNMIDYSEFVMACINREKMLHQERLQVAFNLFDADKKGMISIQEVKSIIGGAQNIDNKVWEDIIREVDENGDGQISLEEFKEMMLSTL